MKVIIDNRIFMNRRYGTIKNYLGLEDIFVFISWKVKRNMMVNICGDIY